MFNWREERIEEVMGFFKYPRELVECLFKYSKEYFEGAWGAFYPKYVDEYYSAGFYAIRQMSYSEKDVFGDIKPILDTMSGSVLDYACGVGDYLIYLAERGVKCYAVEHYGVPINFLKYRFARRNLEIDVLELTFEETYFRGDVFPTVDYALCVSAIDHIRRPINFANRICQSVRRGIYASPCIDETYDRPTHEKEILKEVPKAFEVINDFNRKRNFPQLNTRV